MDDARAVALRRSAACRRCCPESMTSFSAANGTLSRQRPMIGASLRAMTSRVTGRGEADAIERSVLMARALSLPRQASITLCSFLITSSGVIRSITPGRSIFVVHGRLGRGLAEQAAGREIVLVDAPLPAQVRPAALRIGRGIQADHRCADGSRHVRGAGVRRDAAASRAPASREIRAACPARWCSRRAASCCARLLRPCVARARCGRRTARPACRAARSHSRRPARSTRAASCAADGWSRG